MPPAFLSLREPHVVCASPARHLSTLRRRDLHKIGRTIGSPEVYPPFLRTPYPGYVRRIIPDLLVITHELNQVPLRVPEVFKLVLAGAMPPGTIEQHVAMMHEVFGLPCQVGEINHFEGEVMHLDRACFCEGQAMMIGVAAHPEEDVVYPIGDAEAQHLVIEFGAAFAIVHEQGDVAKLARLHCTRAIGWGDLCHAAD